MKSRIIGVIIFLPFIICAGGRNTALKFVDDVYTKHQNNEDISIFKSSVASTIFSPDLLKLIRLDETESNGEAGYLDWDPLCDCQDIGTPGDFKINNIAITNIAGKTIADVKFKISGDNIELSLYLIEIKGKWYIDDIRSKNIESLSKYLLDNLIDNKGKQY